MRPGYFKVDETDEHAAIIFPPAFCKHISAVDLTRWLPHYGIAERLRYVPANATIVPITQNGAPV